MELKGKKVLVTGGASGIGLCLSLRLARLQAEVHILDKSLPVVRNRKGITNHPYIDISDFAQMELQTSLWSTPFDILVNCAGIPLNSFLFSLTEGVHSYWLFDKVIKSNLYGTFDVTRRVVEGIAKGRRPGLIINVSSVLAAGAVSQGAYAASKAGINALTVTWAQELAPYRIRVAGIAPGLVHTKSTMEKINKQDLQEILERTPAGRIAELSEIIDGILWIIGNDYFRGRTLELDGGRRE